MKAPSLLRCIAAALLLPTSIGVAENIQQPNGKSIGDVSLWLTVLHINDSESQLIDAGSGLEDFGGVSREVRKMALLRNEALSYSSTGANAAVIISSGDNYLAGPEFNASQAKPSPSYDAIALHLNRVDVSAIGNHEFDFGPDVLADFIGSQTRTQFVTANLDFSMEPALQAQVEAGNIAPSITLTRNGRNIGVVGATTPELASISSPRDVIINDDVATAVQAEVDQLLADGTDIIILTSHLQSIEEDLDLIATLHGVDIAIAGGGDELLSNPGDLLIPGDEAAVYGPYPLYAVDAEGRNVPIITTSGAYRYIGRLVTGFDDSGELVAIDMADSGPVRVASNAYDDGVGRDNTAEMIIAKPINAYVEDLDTTIIATSTVALDGVRGNVRTMETNQGNLIADSLLSEAQRLAASFGVPPADIALQNGGGIRNDSVIAAGDITLLNTFDMVPFSNFLSVIPGISRAQFKEIMENAVSRVEQVNGRFAQVAGFTIAYDASAQAQDVDDAGTVLVEGHRVQSIMLDDGTMIVDNGDVIDGPDLTVATINFLANGGDQYPFRGAPYTTLGLTYQQALQNYIINTLGGSIDATGYPEGGEGRIVRLN
ncbi:MAG: hypothetical protein DHS20C11_24660 [Lysobacteraceae bacterium]|nr:MAG: hypothetical protein DHS20C11_24660 [Xanthomonadaceae bacterium]